jgi:hypothetical protein
LASHAGKKTKDNRDCGGVGIRAEKVTGTFIATIIIIPEGWDVVAGGFPAKPGKRPLPMKNVVLLASLLPPDAGPGSPDATITSNRSGESDASPARRHADFAVDAREDGATLSSFSGAVLL